MNTTKITIPHELTALNSIGGDVAIDNLFDNPIMDYERDSFGPHEDVYTIDINHERLPGLIVNHLHLAAALNFMEIHRVSLNHLAKEEGWPCWFDLSVGFMVAEGKIIETGIITTVYAKSPTGFTLSAHSVTGIDLSEYDYNKLYQVVGKSMTVR